MPSFAPSNPHTRPCSGYSCVSTAHKVLSAAPGTAKNDAAEFAKIGEIISGLERRSMEAERDTVDRYVAAWLSGRAFKDNQDDCREAATAAGNRGGTNGGMAAAAAK